MDYYLLNLFVLGDLYYCMLTIDFTSTQFRLKYIPKVKVFCERNKSCVIIEMPHKRYVMFSYRILFLKQILRKSQPIENVSAKHLTPLRSCASQYTQSPFRFNYTQTHIFERICNHSISTVYDLVMSLQHFDYMEKNYLLCNICDHPIFRSVCSFKVLSERTRSNHLLTNLHTNLLKHSFLLLLFVLGSKYYLFVCLAFQLQFQFKPKVEPELQQLQKQLLTFKLTTFVHTFVCI